MESILPFLRGLCLAIQAVSALMIIVLVLIHSPKGDGLSSMGGGSQIFSSQKGAEAALNKITAYTAGVFYVISFILAHYIGA